MTENGFPRNCYQGLSFSYDGHPVLEDVNLSIPQGDFVSVVGPNGGGKTTLLKLMLGLLRPSHGEVRVFGVTPEKARSAHRIYAPACTVGSRSFLRQSWTWP